MSDWKAVLKTDPTRWLLEENNPSVRYSTLMDLLEIPQTETEVERARKAIMERGAVPKTLAKQRKGGYWEAARDFYIRTKYKGTVWQLITLAELRADGNDERIRKACEFVLEHSQDRKSGGFSHRSGEGGGGDHERLLPCLTGNMVWSLIRFGYLDDPRVQRGIRWIVEYQRFDDGVEESPRGWPYDRLEKCWGRHTCHMGVVKALKALAEIPTSKRSNDVKRTIERGVDYVLKHHIHKRSHNLDRVSKPEWLRFGFPLMWNTDILEILGILTRLGCRDGRVREAVELVISKQDDQGRWKLENTFNGRVQVNIEQKGKTSKWITLNALDVLKRFHSPRQI
jgi:hypothetical protein